MNWETIIVAIIAAAVSPGIWSFMQNRRKTTADVQLAEAQVKVAEAQKDNYNADTQSKIIVVLQDEVDKQQKRIDKLEDRLLVSEERAATAEARAATADSRAFNYGNMFDKAKSEMIKLGEEITKERKENQNKFNTLALLVSRLIQQVRSLGATPEISDDEAKILDRLVVIGG